ncbi:MAG TPA: hypothetical protein PKX87_02015 [Alphaproteobacteria bacterium]|nr:hypothetical protein [Alphaproteobacteria bacterium]
MMNTAARSLTALFLAGSALVATGCAPSQDDYALRWPDGTNRSGLHGLRGCVDAFAQTIKDGIDADAVCVPDGEGPDNRPIRRVRAMEKTLLYNGPAVTPGAPLSGAVAMMPVGWDTLPPWARGSTYIRTPR